jgi:hypothetical protein
LAATYLLLDSLKAEVDICQFDWFDWIAQEGLLTVPEILAIGRAVWQASQ